MADPAGATVVVLKRSDHRVHARRTRLEGKDMEYALTTNYYGKGVMQGHARIIQDSWAEAGNQIRGKYVG